jgi:hypothetical protein
MRRLITKKRIAVAIAVPVVALGGVVAYAFWTTGGTGSGTASTTSPTSNLIVTVSVPTAMVLAGSPEAVDIVSVNNINGYSVDLMGDTASINTISCGGNPVSTAWFTLSTGTITDTTVYPASATTTNGVPPASGLTLQMNDVNADQDACQGAAVTFTILVHSETGN